LCRFAKFGRYSPLDGLTIPWRHIKIIAAKDFLMSLDSQEKISTIEELEEHISRPSSGAVEALAKVDGDVLVLGAGGKMGPSLARMTKRASDEAGIKRRIIAVSRFASGSQQEQLSSWEIETIPCDLLSEDQLQKLPDAENVIFMAGMKFGSTGNESLTWAMNVYMPGRVFEKYRDSRLVVFSSGNIYGLSPVDRGGSVETDIPNPQGEYANSVLGRERILEHFSKKLGAKAAVIRLNYAVELRYGVLVDIAQKVWNGEPVDVSMGFVNVIWQADANAMALASLKDVSSPPFVLNVAGPEIVRVRDIAEQFGKIFNRPAKITGVEKTDALLSNGNLGYNLYGEPSVNTRQMITWIADWVTQGGETIGKPTHFETRDGKY